MPSLPSTFNRKALCIGIEYRNAKNALPGAHEDCQAVAKVLRDKLGYEVTTLMDDGKGSSPTRDNILRAIRELVADAQSGDRIFLHYSGHGGQIENTNNTESDGQDEVLIPIDPTIPVKQWDTWDPCDDKRLGWRESIIVDDELHKLLVPVVPPGCHFNALFDTCNSGTALDLKFNLRCKEVSVRTCICTNCEDDDERGPCSPSTEIVPYRWDQVSKKCLDEHCSSSPNAEELTKLQKDINLWAACRDGTRAWGTKSGGLFVKTILNVLQSYNYDMSSVTLSQFICTTDHMLREKAIKAHTKGLRENPQDQLQYFQYSSSAKPMLNAPIMI